MTQDARRPPVQGQRREAAKLQQTLTVAKRIGKGRLGVVYAAVHAVLARRFAVKVLRPGLTRDEEVQLRLRHMIREASQVDHPSVTSLVDFGQLPDGRYYLTMDFVRGIQLSRVLERDGRVSLSRAVVLLDELASALDAVHRMRVVHGDLKPNNVMLIEDAQGGEGVRLLDLCISSALAGVLPEAEPDAYLMAYGQVEYLAPEQIAGRSIDGCSDIYAYGALAYRLLTGQPPFVGEPEQVLRAHRNVDPVPPSRRSGAHATPAELDALVLRCLEKNPRDRFGSMREVQQALQTMLPAVGAPTYEEAEEQEPEEITGRWVVAPQLEEAPEEPLPDAPGKIRALFYDTIYELTEHIVELGAGHAEMRDAIDALGELREESSQLASQIELTENRFEDIRRELRERESTLRYAIIDLNLAKSDLAERDVREGSAVSDLEYQIARLEESLAQLERERRERFAQLNRELQSARERNKTLEHQMAAHYRRLYAELDEVRGRVDTELSRQLLHQLERCRQALSSGNQGGRGLMAEAPAMPGRRPRESYGASE